jgi:hypothetical protein
MNAPNPHVAVYPSADARDDPPSRPFQMLWFSLARIHWKSIVLVPADEDGSAAAIATSLAEVGKRLCETPVTAIVASSLDFNSARVLADLQEHVQEESRGGTVVDVLASVVPPWHEAVGSGGSGPGAEKSGRAGHGGTVRALPPAGQVIVAVPSVLLEPLGLGVARAADAAIVCIHRGRTRLAAARQTIELIGRERLIGSFLIG